MSAAASTEEAELLRRLYRASLRRLVERMEGGDDVTAAELSVARATLADNGVSLDRLGQLDRGAAAQILDLDLPSFDDG